jgi:hypothetical protein
MSKPQAKRAHRAYQTSITCVIPTSINLVAFHSSPRISSKCPSIVIPSSCPTSPSPYSTRFSPPGSRFRTLPPIFTSPYRSGAFQTLSRARTQERQCGYYAYWLHERPQCTQCLRWMGTARSDDDSGGWNMECTSGIVE